MFQILKGSSTKHYVTNAFRSNNDYIENNLHTKYDNRTFSNINSITKHINNYSNDVANTYKINKIQNLKKTYYNFNDDITLNKTIHSYSNDTINLTRTNRLFNITDNNYYTKKQQHK